MKKFFALCLVAVLTLALVGCGNKDEVVNDNDIPVQSGENVEFSGDNEVNTEIESGEINEEVVSGEASGELPVEDEKEEIKIPEEDNPVVNEPVVNATTATEMMTKIITAAKIEIPAPYQDVIPAEMSESYVGLNSGDFTKYVSDSVFYEPMISPANQSFCIVKVNDLSKVNELKQKMFDNCNPRKWICMTAERVVVLSSGEYIMLAMASQDSCNALITAFKAEFGEAKVGTILDKTVSESIENMEDLPGGGMAL